MSTKLAHAIDLTERLQAIAKASGVHLETLDTILAEMKDHEAEHGWINDRLNMLIEIYNIIGADGSQCIDRIKSNFEKAKIMQDALSEIYNFGTGKAQDVARLALEKL